MKKIIATILTLGLSAGFAGAAASVNTAYADTQLTSACKSAYLCDFNSGECIYKQNETERLPIASVCKVMTLTLCFDAIQSGKLSLEDKITVSDRAAGMGGSQVFLQTGLSYPLSELIKSIIVCSANDSCVAVSESISGSEESFVALMNKRAEELGCNDTLFANCTGLPKEPQYSCAKDVAVMFTNLIKNEEYFKYSKIWLEDFNHPEPVIEHTYCRFKTVFAGIGAENNGNKPHTVLNRRGGKAKTRLVGKARFAAVASRIFSDKLIGVCYGSSSVVGVIEIFQGNKYVRLRVCKLQKQGCPG